MNARPAARGLVAFVAGAVVGFLVFHSSTGQTAQFYKKFPGSACATKNPTDAAVQGTAGTVNGSGSAALDLYCPIVPDYEMIKTSVDVVAIDFCDGTTAGKVTASVCSYSLTSAACGPNTESGVGTVQCYSASTVSISQLNTYKWAVLYVTLPAWQGPFGFSALKGYKTEWTN